MNGVAGVVVGIGASGGAGAGRATMVEGIQIVGGSNGRKELAPMGISKVKVKDSKRGDEFMHVNGVVAGDIT